MAEREPDTNAFTDNPAAAQLRNRVAAERVSAAVLKAGPESLAVPGAALVALAYALVAAHVSVDPEDQVPCSACFVVAGQIVAGAMRPEAPRG